MKPMRKDSLEILAKRMLFFTKVILTLIIINIIIFVNYLDLQENIRLKSYLNLINSIEQIDDRKLYYTNFELERAKYLHRVNPALSEKHQDSRNIIATIVEEFGESNVRDMKGQGDSMNRFVLMESAKYLKNGGFNEVLSVLETEQTKIIVVENTVNDALDKFLDYGGQEKYYLVTAVDDELLRQKFEAVKENKKRNFQISEDVVTDNVSEDYSELGISIEEIDEETSKFNNDLQILPQKDLENNNIKRTPNEIEDDENLAEDEGYQPSVIVHNRRTKSLFKFSNLFINGNTLHISLSDRDFEREGIVNPNQSGFIGWSTTITIPVTLDSLTFPSTLYFAGYDSAIVKELYGNKINQENIRNLYGSYVLSAVGRLSEDVVNKNSEAVSILGFDVSRKWFPIAMFLTLVIIYHMLYINIKKAKKDKVLIFKKYISDDPLEFLVDRLLLRFSVWVLSPAFLLSLVLYSSLITYNVMYYTVLFVCSAFCIALGIVSYKNSLVL